jgi:hypothetical protein
MSLYSDYTEDQQRLLRRSVMAAAVAVSAASPGRPEETVSEGFAAARFLLERRGEYVGNTLVSSLIQWLVDRVEEEQPFPDYSAEAGAAGAREGAIETLRSVAALLDEHSTPEEGAGFRAWLLRISEEVAVAGREDQGFLGRGGVAVNDVERAALAEVAGALGLPAPPADAL